MVRAIADGRKLTNRARASTDVTARLRAAGLKPTRQRVALGLLLFSNGDRHLTAEMLFQEAAGASIPASLATVYNTLHSFAEVGLLRHVGVIGGKAFFDTNTSHHQHFFVDHNGTLIDIPTGVSVQAWPEPPEGTRVVRIDVVVRLRPDGSGSPPSILRHWRL